MVCLHDIFVLMYESFHGIRVWEIFKTKPISRFKKSVQIITILSKRVDFKHKINWFNELSFDSINEVIKIDIAHIELCLR